MVDFRTAPLFVLNLQLGGMPPIRATSCGNCPREDPRYDVIVVI